MIVDDWMSFIDVLIQWQASSTFTLSTISCLDLPALSCIKTWRRRRLRYLSFKVWITLWSSGCRIDVQLAGSIWGLSFVSRSVDGWDGALSKNKSTFFCWRRIFWSKSFSKSVKMCDVIHALVLDRHVTGSWLVLMFLKQCGLGVLSILFAANCGKKLRRSREKPPPSRCNHFAWGVNSRLTTSDFAAYGRLSGQQRSDTPLTCVCFIITCTALQDKKALMYSVELGINAHSNKIINHLIMINI